MQIIKTPPAPAGQSYAATIGFFDGVHRGHRFLIAALRELAERKGLLSAVLTFPEHPRNVLKDGHIPAILTTFDEKMKLLEATGIDACLLMDFTPALAAMTARDFIIDVLHRQWNVNTLLIGYDHRFGHDRTDGFEQYAAYGAECGMEVVRAGECAEGTISSSLIRCAIAEGRVDYAAELLTCPYRLRGRVVHGQGFGHTLGFPTANIAIDEPRKILPAAGVYAVRVILDGQQRHKGMLSIGNRPTLDGNETTIEVHILDFSQTIYNQDIEVEFVARLRDNIRFDTTDSLRQQLDDDCQRTDDMLTESKIPNGTTLEDIKERKKLIRDFYAFWNAANPTKQVYNANLKEFINVRYLSINETAEIASRRYISTYAIVHYFTEILELAKEVRRTKPKHDNENQKRFSEMIALEYSKKEFGTIKLTVGVLRGSRQHIQYCITAIEEKNT
ncbi:MAG: riboflavin biosynthesis protein RibF [Tannerella sp.]|jgi:riboflavin kinase/FMN adenylyltransferase|nr:riboflavin biosynthesis protein RibF [Tannerella sp.]